MLRTAIVGMEMEFTQEEFEEWLLKALKRIAVHPEMTIVEKVM